MNRKNGRIIAIVTGSIVAIAGAAWATLITGQFDWIVLGSDTTTGTSNTITFTQASSAIDFDSDGRIYSANTLAVDGGVDLDMTSVEDTLVNSGEDIELTAADNIRIESTQSGGGVALISEGLVVFNTETGVISQSKTGVIMANTGDAEGEDPNPTQALVLLPESELTEGEFPEGLENASLLTSEGGALVGTISGDFSLEATLHAASTGDISIESSPYSSMVSNRSSVTCEKNGDVLIQLGGDN